MRNMLMDSQLAQNTLEQPKLSLCYSIDTINYMDMKRL